MQDRTLRALELFTEPERIDRAFLRRCLLARTGGSALSEDDLAAAIEASLCFSVYREQRQIAFARFVTDRAVFAFMADFCVDTQCCDAELSRAILDRMLQHPHLHGLKVYSLSFGAGDAERQGGLVHRLASSERTMVRFLPVSRP